MMKLFITLGVIFIIFGFLWPLLNKFGLGHLPGDIIIRGKTSTFYFPLVTCLLVSLLVSLVFWFINK